jgi:isopenicillin N synthase-like dioxygenase
VLENAFVCNGTNISSSHFSSTYYSNSNFATAVGDMLDMITGGRFKSVPHRVLPPAPGTARFSFPFFFDFSWTAKMVHLPLDHLPPLSAAEEAEAKQRWAKTTFTSVSGEWWQYLAKKVKKVFPELQLPDFEHNISPSTRFTIAVPVQV